MPAGQRSQTIQLRSKLQPSFPKVGIHKTRGHRQAKKEEPHIGSSPTELDTSPRPHFHAIPRFRNNSYGCPYFRFRNYFSLQRRMFLLAAQSGASGLDEVSPSTFTLTRRAFCLYVLNSLSLRFKVSGAYASGNTAKNRKTLAKEKIAPAEITFA